MDGNGLNKNKNGTEYEMEWNGTELGSFFDAYSTCSPTSLFPIEKAWLCEAKRCVLARLHTLLSTLKSQYVGHKSAGMVRYAIAIEISSLNSMYKYVVIE